MLISSIDEGDELTHSYVDSLEDTKTRSRRLYDVRGQGCEIEVTAQLLTGIVPATLYAWNIHHRNPIAERTEQGDSIEISGRGSRGEHITMSVDEALLSCGGRTDSCGPNETSVVLQDPENTTKCSTYCTSHAGTPLPTILQEKFLHCKGMICVNCEVNFNLRYSSLCLTTNVTTVKQSRCFKKKDAVR